MAYSTITLAKGAFKKAFGKAHTSNDKEIGNESIPSSFSLGTDNIFGQVLDSDPSVAVAQGIVLNCTGSHKLSLSLDNTSNGKAYFAVVPSSPTHPLKSYINPSTGLSYATGDRVTRIIPQAFGTSYRPIILNGATEVTPFASQNWVFDTVAGVLTSEVDLSLGSSGTVECYVYVGEMLTDTLGKQGALALPVGAKSATVVFDEPFRVKPGLIQVQWCFSPNLTTTGVIPTVTVDQISREGFVARWSNTTLSAGYVLRWEAYPISSTPLDTVSLKAYISPSSFGTNVKALNLDILAAASTLAATLSTSASYLQGGSSKTKGYFAGGETSLAQVLASIHALTYTTETLSILSGSLPSGKSKGASIGDKSKALWVGGRSSLSIVKFATLTETASLASTALASSSTAKGSSNSYDLGYVVLDSSAFCKINFDTDAVSSISASGASNMSTGCNDTSSGVGYFARDTSNTVSKLNYSTETVSSLSTTLTTSSSGRSCAFNSLTSGFFVGSVLDQIDFTTETVTVQTLGLTASSSGESSAIQSQGLL